MATSNEDKPIVLIIGAGLTGLLAAQGLKQVRQPMQIYEASSGSFLNRTRTVSKQLLSKRKRPSMRGPANGQCSCTGPCPSFSAWCPRTYSKT